MASPPPLPRAVRRAPTRPPLLHWPAIAAAGTLALLIVVSALFLVASTARSAPPVEAGLEQPAALRSATEPLPPPPPGAEPARPEVVTAMPTPVADKEPDPLQPVQAATARTRPPGTCAAAKSRPAAGAERFQRHGTAVDFARSPDLADDLARTAKKLRFVLHLSGHLEEAGFT
jgi:hypothetical protein